MSETDEQPSHDYVVHRGASDTEWARFGGVKFGIALFGWLSATGMLVLLTAPVTANGAALGVATGTDVEQSASQASENPRRDRRERDSVARPLLRRILRRPEGSVQRCKAGLCWLRVDRPDRRCRGHPRCGRWYEVRLLLTAQQVFSPTREIRGFS